MGKTNIICLYHILKDWKAYVNTNIWPRTQRDTGTAAHIFNPIKPNPQGSSTFRFCFAPFYFSPPPIASPKSIWWRGRHSPPALRWVRRCWIPCLPRTVYPGFAVYFKYIWSPRNSNSRPAKVFMNITTIFQISKDIYRYFLYWLLLAIGMFAFF